MRMLLLLLTCGFTIGCTKPAPPPERASEPQKTAPAPATRANDTRAAIVILGDSLAEGLGVPESASFPSRLQRKLDENNLAYRVVNLGVSGDTTTGGLGRIEHALSFKPSVLMLELGGNDGLRGIPVEATAANLEKMIVAANKAGAQVLLAGMSLPPNYGPEYIRKFEAVYKGLADKYRLQRIPFLMQDIAKQLESRPDLLQRDGIHPSADGHAVIASTVFRYLRPMLAR
jgi:acyl-CoA thioesterase-1